MGHISYDQFLLGVRNKYKLVLVNFSIIFQAYTVYGILNYVEGYLGKYLGKTQPGNCQSLAKRFCTNLRFFSSIKESPSVCHFLEGLESSVTQIFKIFLEFDFGKLGVHAFKKQHFFSESPQSQCCLDFVIVV